MNRLKHLMAGALVLLSAAACADLDVTNPNAADAQRALQTAGDVESLISGSFNTWHAGNTSQAGAGNFLSNASFQHTAPWANFCMEEYARIPRIALVNEAAHGCYGNFASPWVNSYRALAAASDGLKAINENPELAEELGPEKARRAEAFARFIQGISHAQLAILFDQGWVIDETVDIVNPPDPVEYPALLAAAMDQLDAAISLAGQGFEDIPSSWMRSQGDLSPAEFARIAHSMKARYRASLPRSPSEDVDWSQVMADVDAGITEDFIYRAFNSDGWFNGVVFRTQISGWSETTYFVWGMADQSGNYDLWESLPLGDKDANVNGQPILIVTPDLRFAQGSTLEEQQENPGTKFGSPTNMPSMWAQPGRGTWRWSHYRINQDEGYWRSVAEEPLPMITVEEMQLLKAEGLLDAGQTGAAVDIINETRVAAGLNPTDASGTNTDCVPRLAGGECGDLFEMYKWEKRLGTLARGPLHVAMYFDSRRWGDLYEGTYLQFPAPCQDMEILSIQCTTYGGVGGQMASPGSSYNYSTEGG